MILLNKIFNDKLIGKLLKTFIEGFVAHLIMVLPNIDITNFNIVKSMMFGAVTMGISAVLNLIQEKLNKCK